MTDLDPDSLAVLDLARAARTPNDDDKARVGHRLALALGASAAATAAGAASSAARAEASASLVKASGAGVAKWIGGSALLAATVAGYVALSRPAAHVVAPPRAPRVAPSAAPQAQQSPAQLPAAQAPAAQPEPTRAAEPTAHRVARKHHAVASDSLPAELELLHRAQQAWRARQPREALALLGEHQSRYPQSQLDVERDALHALALCELGRTAEAKRIAESVIARAPHSPLRASLEQSCALK